MSLLLAKYLQNFVLSEFSIKIRGENLVKQEN